MFCCPNCFYDGWLKQFIQTHSPATGDCDFCETENAQIIGVNELTGLFANLLSMYVEADTYERGEILIDLIQWNWQVFDDEALDREKQISLLEEIVNSDWDDDDGEMPVDGSDLYMSIMSREYHITHREEWNNFVRMYGETQLHPSRSTNTFQRVSPGLK